MSPLDIQLKIPEEAHRGISLSGKHLDSDQDVTDFLCEALHDEGIATFSVSGFDLDWPVDIRTDLSVVLPQIPNSLKKLRSMQSASLEFYEQGIERTIVFPPDGDTVVCKQLIGNATLGSIIQSRSLSVSILEDVVREFNRWAQARVRDVTTLKQCNWWNERPNGEGG